MDAAHDQQECETVAGIARMAIALVFVLRLSATAFSCSLPVLWALSLSVHGSCCRLEARLQGCPNES